MPRRLRHDVANTVAKALTGRFPFSLNQDSPETIEEARQKVTAYVSHYNQIRLHSAIGYITPADKLNGLASQIHAERDRKLEEARARRLAVRPADTNVA